MVVRFNPKLQEIITISLQQILFNDPNLHYMWGANAEPYRLWRPVSTTVSLLFWHLHILFGTLDEVVILVEHLDLIFVWAFHKFPKSSCNCFWVFVRPSAAPLWEIGVFIKQPCCFYFFSSAGNKDGSLVGCLRTSIWCNFPPASVNTILEPVPELVVGGITEVSSSVSSTPLECSEGSTGWSWGLLPLHSRYGA